MDMRISKVEREWDWRNGEKKEMKKKKMGKVERLGIKKLGGVKLKKEVWEKYIEGEELRENVMRNLEEDNVKERMWLKRIRNKLKKKIEK